MGSGRWEELYDQFYDRVNKESYKNNYNKMDVCNLEIYKEIKSVTSNWKDFNSKEDTISWITCVFTLHHSIVLYETHKKKEMMRIEKREALKKEMENETNSKERDRKASLFFGALNLSFKEITNTMCLNFGHAKAEQSSSNDNSIFNNEKSRQIAENRPSHQN